MKLYLLDAGGAGLVFGVLIVFMIVAVVIEALVMLAMKYNKAGKAFLDSFVINLITLGFGFILMANDSLELTENVFLNYTFLYLVTVVAEMLVLYLLNRSKPFIKTMLASMAINAASYGLLFLFTFL
jgi:hypothetical protein